MTDVFIKELSGHSGCKIDLMQDCDNVFFVRKKSGNTDYNHRLRIQMIKQARFKDSGFRAPRVFKSGLDENSLFYFDMEYLNCQTLAHYINDITLHNLVKIIDLFHIPKSDIVANSNSVFQSKIQSLRSKVGDNVLYNQALDRLEHFDFSNIPHSVCHGDLTLENILIDYKDGKIYLIDFLDSFFDSWMIDVAKLLQDLELGWSYRYEKMSPGLEIRLLVARESLLEIVSALPDGATKIIEIYYILLLNVMRIVPYAHDEITNQFLEKSILKIFNILDTKEQKK